MGRQRVTSHTLYGGRSLKFSSTMKDEQAYVDEGGQGLRNSDWAFLKQVGYFVFPASSPILSSLEAQR